MVDARGAAHRVLTDLERGQIDRVADGLARARLSDRDNALARELAFGVERRRSLLDHVLMGYLDRGLPADPGARAALRLGAYQLLFTPGIKTHAAVFETVALVPKPKKGGANLQGMVNAVLRKVAGSVEARPADPAKERVELPLPGDRCAVLVRKLPDRASEPASFLAVRYALPQFLVARWVEHFGVEAAEAAAIASSATPAVFLRGRVDGGDLAALLEAEGVTVVATDHPMVWRWTEGPSPFRTEAFRAGRFVAQDPTAVRAAEAVGAEPGESILDLCAAPGTKASLLADQVGPAGKVFAFDVDPQRRERILEAAGRLGLGHIAVVDNPSALPPVDRVLVDVPCSNTGVLARRIEVRRRLGPESLEHLVPLQEGLLRQAMGRVKPRGVVVYSTCSVEPEEGGQLVQRVLQAYPRWSLESELLTLPATPDHDGGYHAVLRAPRS